jgi:arylsulfatase A-like enzyme
LRWATLLVLAAACGTRVDPERYPAVSRLERELSVAVRSPAGGAADGSRCATLAARGGGLYLPPGGRLTLYAELPARGALRFERVARCGGSARLLVEVATDRAGKLALVIEPVPGPLALRLPANGGPARLRLAVVGEGGGLLVGGLGLGMWGASVRPPAQLAMARGGGRRPNLLVYLVDALRRDGLGCYGNPRPVSPHFDQLAEEGTVFDDAVAQAAWTRTAVASLFTGLDAGSHGVLTNRHALADSAVTVAERLRGAGYRTFALIANGNIGRKLGFHQGFDVMWQRLSGRRHRAAAMSGELLQWLDTTAAGARPFFAYVHVVEPHGPYEPIEPFRSRFARGVPAGLGSRPSLREIELASQPPSEQTRARLRALYDAEVAASDAAFGELRTGLERRGLWANTVVVVLADHGEEFFEHGRWEHGSTLHEETLSIPLLVRVPGLGAGRRRVRMAQQVDLAPTFLELAGEPPAAGLDGESLLPAMAGAEPLPPPPPARSYQRFADYLESGVTTGGFRLVRTRWDHGSTAVKLYDRRADRQELRDVHAALPITAAFLDSVLRWPPHGGGALVRPAGRLDRETEEQLRALGYVH